MFLKTISAIYRPGTIWFKRNFRFLPTIRTDSFMHFPWRAVITAPSIVLIHISFPSQDYYPIWATIEYVH